MKRLTVPFVSAVGWELRARTRAAKKLSVAYASPFSNYNFTLNKYIDYNYIIACLIELQYAGLQTRIGIIFHARFLIILRLFLTLSNSEAYISLLIVQGKGLINSCYFLQSWQFLIGVFE